jgi:[ribosomal protein S18]-alanine N-acetyltransferase
MHIRQATPTDIPDMVELERENPTSVNWSHEHYESLFGTTALELSEYFVFVAEDSSESNGVTVPPPPSPIVAYLAARRVDRDWELQYIVVAKKSRHRSLATLLLNELIEKARSKSANAIFLEVRESNQSARAFYRKAGFEETGLRKSYYSDPPEDAILCRLMLY